MKIAVLGASGRAGSQIALEAARRGHEVCALARHPEKIPATEGIRAIAGDASDPEALAPLIAGTDAIISALHFDVTAETLLDAVRKAGVSRLLITGGAASLLDPSGQRLIDSPEFPEEWRAFAMGGITFLDVLKKTNDIDWTFFSPPALIFEGEHTGSYRPGTDHLVVDANGESKISFADYAIAMIDELEAHQHSRARFTAAY